MQLPARRTWMLVLMVVAVLGALALGFRDPPVLVDTARVERGRFVVSFEDEGRTRVTDRYDILAPVSGQMSRVLLEPGDPVVSGDVLFAIHPLRSVPLDVRSRAQAEATLQATEAALQAAATLVDSAEATADLAQRELARIQPLVSQGYLPKDHLDRARTEVRRTAAALSSARFGVDVARYERDVAQAALIEGEEGSPGQVIEVRSPVSGTVLQRMRQSAGAVQVGAAVLSIGNLDSLEVAVDVLSPDAVRVRPGMMVELRRWGGDDSLAGRVRRVEPAGFTQVSALGIDEQRVWVIVDLQDPEAVRGILGDGYRVEARFILWSGDEVLQVPTSALFREGDNWGVFVVHDQQAHYRTVTPGRRSGLVAEITAGLDVGERVILHPGQDVHQGVRIRSR